MGDPGDVLPELTRALRALGSRRGVTGTRSAAREQQSRFFESLVGARRAAAAAQSDVELLDAFDAARLRGSFEATLAAFANELYPEYPAAARAVDAQLSEAVEPLMRSIHALEASRASSTGAARDEALRRWAGALQRVFDAADRAWMAVDQVLEHATVSRFAPPPPHRTRGGWRKSG